MTEKEFKRFHRMNRFTDTMDIILPILLIIFVIIATITMVKQGIFEDKVIQEFEKCVYIGDDLYCKVEK